ncbi:MAG: C_GCAxxG_C_C family protein [Thermoguttaceae bacterium]|nr:C_GCAxxG_C_C family protein [Thermoguttaceae bacterium]
MSNEMNRRDALRFAGLAAGAFLVGGSAGNASGAEAGVGGVWKYAVVDPQKVADTAYENYKVGRCMYTTFYGIVYNVGLELEKTDPIAAAPILQFPFYMMKYGTGGANDWGTLCGSLNGAMAAISLFVADSNKRKALCDEIANYYEQTMFPIYKPANDDFGPMPQTISGSLLCHVSSGKWSSLAMKRTDSPERTERCTRMSADVARKTAELLNLNIGTPAALEAAPVVTFKRQEPSATCYDCHGKGKKNSDVIAKMSCNECHDQAVDHHEAK